MTLHNFTMQENHKRFADKYFETLNASLSAEYAGFSVDTARQQGWQLLQREDIQSYLSQLRAELEDKTSISQEKVLREVARIAFADIRKYYREDGELIPICDLEDDAAAALASVETLEEKIPGTDIVVGVNKKVKTYNKLDGLEKLARHLGLYDADNRQKAPEVPKSIQVNIVKPTDE
jgi:phage terminase small subunit